METSEKPKISFTIATLHVPRYGELIASEKRALPTLQKELDEANRLKQDSSVTMRSKRHKLKWGVWNEQQAKKMVRNPCLDEPMQSKPKAIRSMVNAKYMRNLPIMRRNIERGKLESAKAAKELAKYIIK